MEYNWHSKSIRTVLKEIGSDEKGLSFQEAGIRLEKFGHNIFDQVKPDSLLTIFLSQFKSPLIYILILASLVVFLMGEYIEGIIILFILIFNAITGTVQEGKAQNTLLALKKFTETQAVVLRDGKEIIIPDSEVVPGDIMVIQEGEKVSADARVVYSSNMNVDEAILTGESAPVHKICDKLVEGLRMEDWKNMVFKGTNVVSGNGRAVVVATGNRTVIGKIAKEIKGIDTETPLKANIRQLSVFILYTAGIVSLSLFIIGTLIGKPFFELFMIAVSLTVSIVPEGLPIVVTLVLAMGVWRMSKKNSLVKRLQAVEALGQASVIAVDKTGTITKNEMVVRKVYLNGSMLEVEGDGYEPKGRITENSKLISSSAHSSLSKLKRVSSLVSGARLLFSEEKQSWEVKGDPTDGAILVLSKKIKKAGNPYDIISEHPFDYKLKYRSVVYKEKDSKKNILVIVGAPEVVLSACSNIGLGEKTSKMTEERRTHVMSIFKSMSEEGLRVIAFAEKQDSKSDISIDKMSFLGFYGIRDTIRPETKEVISKITKTGVKVVMITGDYELTARAIAEEAGIYKEGDKVMIGSQVDHLSQSELIEEIEGVSVFARFNPEHKLKIIQAYKAKGEVVAMTGDGVNDAPSLVAADLGITMGNSGTEVAKEAADIILLDDNFHSIVHAIEEGRNIYRTIKKVVLYLFSTSLGEVLIISVALFLNFPLPILAAQIIWINFVTDGFLDVSLAMEPKEENLLSRKVKKGTRHIIDSLMIKRIILMSLVMAIGTLLVFSHYLETAPEKVYAVSFTLMAVFQWFNAWNCRSDDRSVFKGVMSNKYLLVATGIVIILQSFAVYHPVMQAVFKTVPLGIMDWVMIILTGSLIVLAEEIRKYFSRKRSRINLY